MPGYYIRTGSGIVPVKDWYVKTLADTSSNTTHSMTAGTSGGGSRGYENGNAAIGGGAYGSLSPLSAGGIEVRGLTYALGATGDPTIVYLGPAGAASTPVPPDDDTSFSRIDITGTFADGAGTRTLLRASADFTNSGSNGTRQWQFRGSKAAQFVSGNTYSAVIQRAGAVGPVIRRVKEAYIRTASGIQKYWPAASEHAMVAANMDAGAALGYSNGGYYGFTPGGSMTPTASDAYYLTSLLYQPSTNKLLLSMATDFGAPADSDATWKSMDVTGIFSDSAGGSVTRTFLRTQLTTNGANAFHRGWEVVGGAVVIPKFIAGNSYNVKIVRG